MPFLQSLVNVDNNLLASSILILSVTLNCMSQILEMFWLNHKHNSFKITDFTLYFNNLPIYNCYTQLRQSNPHIYINFINLSCNYCITLYQSYLNSSNLHTIIYQHIHISYCINISMHLRTNLGPCMNIKSNSLHTFIN